MLALAVLGLGSWLAARALPLTGSWWGIGTSFWLIPAVLTAVLHQV